MAGRAPPNWRVEKLDGCASDVNRAAGGHTGGVLGDRRQLIYDSPAHPVSRRQAAGRGWHRSAVQRANQALWGDHSWPAGDGEQTHRAVSERRRYSRRAGRHRGADLPAIAHSLEHAQRLYPAWGWACAAGRGGYAAAYAPLRALD